MDAVITQDADDTITRCAAFFANLRSGQPPAINPEAMRIEVIFRENLPASSVRAADQPARATVSAGSSRSAPTAQRSDP
jgi:hypothetical protein